MRRPKQGTLLQQADLRPGELQQELQRVGLHRRSAHHPRSRNGKLLLRAAYPLLGHPRELPLREHVVVVGLGEQRRLELGLDLVRFGPRHPGARCSDVEHLRETAEQVEAKVCLRLADLVREATGPDVEEVHVRVGAGQLQCRCRNDEHGVRRPLLPLGVHDAPHGGDVVRIHAGGTLERLQRSGESEHHRASTGSSAGAPRQNRNRIPSSST
jgi:hypothetical protein